MDVSSGIYLSGLARGGTTWARQIIAAHPDVFEVPTQVGFKAPKTVNFDQEHIENRIRQILSKIPNEAENLACMDASKHFIVKAPPNALILSEMIDILPNTHHFFIMRDPRDVLVSHQRTGAAWTEAHRNFDMAMERSATFYRGYAKAKDRDDLMLFRYEDIHQKFPSTFKKICNFIGLEADNDLINTAMKALSFRAVTGRGHAEQQGMNRRGVAGDWVKNLSYMDAERLKQNPFWRDVMAKHGYDWDTISVRSILSAYAQADMANVDLGAPEPGAHTLWSLSNTIWDNMEAVNGTLRRCRQCLAFEQEHGLNSTLMLATELPARVIKPLLNTIQHRPVYLEVNLDSFSHDPDLRDAEIVEFIDGMIPTLKALNVNANLQAIVYGENTGIYALVIDMLKSRKFTVHTLNVNDKFPIVWVKADATNALTLYGPPEGFVPAQPADWTALKNRTIYFMAEMAASHLDDPLSYGFRTCFDDVRKL